MSIDRSILSEFIKATNDNKETKQTQLYGTVVTQGNSKCVKIDGSEIVTPVRSITDIKDDERVMVSIKDHMATVTGNMTNPSVGNDRVESAEGKIDRFDHLFAGNITAENIAAGSITTDKLLAGSITTDKLMAECITSDKISANSIESKHIKADAIESEHIKAGSIEAEHIKAGTIEADHISSGTITADKIATGTITAGSGIIADGAIGNAQISKIDAAKIEAGTIDTSKVTIQGSNGHLRLKGNRMQVFDGVGTQAKERVSVGDINGDGSIFGLRVRGADGQTILLDENGVKSEGITDGSITNDKISEDANIDGAKLNINSVVSKINEDGTETIQGTKIEVDGTTLNTKLSTITTKQTEDSEKISQAQSQITANTNAIKLKVDEQTYTTDKKDMTSKLEKNTSEISTMKGQIALKVEHTDIENAKSELEGAMDSKINSAKAEIKVTTDAISQNVSNLSQTVSTKADGSTVTTLSNKVGSLETGVNGISGKVTSLEKTTTTLGTQVDTANTNASSALNKANSATTTANNAQNTANTNKNNITDLQGEVSIVKSNVASLEVTTSGISQKVSSVESTTTTLSGKVNTANNNATNALNKANSANTLADSKAKVFTSTPTVPYKVGDLWVQGTNGDVMKCKTARASGSYTASDWEKASKYTDDTKANAVDGKVTTLQGTVNTTNSKVATLETNLNGITQRVSSTENTTATLTTKVNNAQNTANQAKTDAGNANNNATNAINKANDANAKVDGIQVGGRNLLLNSGNFKNTSQWFLNGGSNLRVENKDGFSCLSATGSVKHNAIKLEPDTKYIYWTEIMFNTDVSVNNIIPLHYWLKSMPSGTTKGSVSIVSGSGTAKANKWNKIVLQITTGSLVNGDTHIELTPFIYKNPMPESWWMKYIKVEKGTKATDWSPAPEDVQSQIDTHTTQITTTNNKVSEIKTDLNGITSRVGTVESKQTTTDGKITGLETRMTTAESKITESAITNTVKKNFYTKTETDSQITSKGYQTSSQVQQTVDALQMKFEQSGGYNLLKNSAFKNGTNGWSTLRWDTQAGGNNNIGVRNIGNDWTPTNRNSLDASVTNLPNTSVNKPLRAGFDSHKFKVRPNTAYTLNCLMAQHRTRSITIEMLCYDSADNRIGTSSYSVTLSNVKSGGRDRNNWTKVKHTWTTPSNAVTCHLRAYMNEWTGEGDSAFMWICEPLITEGNSNLPWTPNADEVYTGITAIDKDGITVTSSNVKSKTSMSSSGFKITKTDTNTDVFKVNSDGTLYMEGEISLTSSKGIKGKTTRKIVIANDNYCVYDGTETDINRKVFMGFRPYNSNAQYIPSVMLGYNGINPNVDGAVVSGGTYTTYSHYPNNNNPESINLSYGALAFKYGASGTQFSTLNMYQNGDIDLKAGSGIYFRPSLRNKNNHVFGMTDTEVGCRVPFKCTSTIFTNGDITTDRNIHAYGNISASGSMSCGNFMPSNIDIGSSVSMNSNGLWTSGKVTAQIIHCDAYRYTNGTAAFGKSSYNNNMLNGVNWDWQYYNLVNVKVYPVSLSLPTIDEPTIQTVSKTQKDTLSQIKFPEARELSVEESAPPIDISNVTNKEEITTNGDVDLIKLVYLLVKDVQELKQENDELRKMIKEL